jgi:hypothetical protein
VLHWSWSYLIVLVPPAQIAYLAWDRRRARRRLARARYGAPLYLFPAEVREGAAAAIRPGMLMEGQAGLAVVNLKAPAGVAWMIVQGVGTSGDVTTSAGYANSKRAAERRFRAACRRPHGGLPPGRAVSLARAAGASCPARRPPAHWRARP